MDLKREFKFDNLKQNPAERGKLNQQGYICNVGILTCKQEF